MLCDANERMGVHPVYVARVFRNHFKTIGINRFQTNIHNTHETQMELNRNKQKKEKKKEFIRQNN